MALGIPYARGAALRRGQISIIWSGSTLSGTTPLGDTAASIVGAAREDNLGSWLASTSDVDGDGIDDLATTGGLRGTTPGRVWVYAQLRP